MSTHATPPEWADLLLRVFLKARDFDTVAGDLLEEYRGSISPSRGQRRADAWYVTQVLGLGWRSVRMWAIVFAVAFLGRTALDWLVPTTDFHLRSTVSTFLGAGVLLTAASWAAWRAQSFAAGPVFAIATAAVAAPFKLAGVATLLALWHDPMTMDAIRGSGGLEEALMFPLLIVLPALALGTLGGVVGTVSWKLGRQT